MAIDTSPGRGTTVRATVPARHRVQVPPGQAAPLDEGSRRAAGQAGCGMLASTASPLGALSISPSCNAR